MCHLDPILTANAKSERHQSFQIYLMFSLAFAKKMIWIRPWLRSAIRPQTPKYAIWARVSSWISWKSSEWLENWNNNIARLSQCGNGANKLDTRHSSSHTSLCFLRILWFIANTKLLKQLWLERNRWFQYILSTCHRVNGGQSQKMGFRHIRSSSKIHGILIFNGALMETQSCCALPSDSYGISARMMMMMRSAGAIAYSSVKVNLRHSQIEMCAEPSQTRWCAINR